MLRSLHSGISGLRSHQEMLDVTGNNIANVNTVGFKSSSTVFQDTLSQMTQGAGGPQTGIGGTNPAQIGLGVQVAGVSTNFAQGSAQATGKATDLMISGDGFFVTRLGNDTVYTRAGAFDFDADGRATIAFDLGFDKADAVFGLAIGPDDSLVLSGNVEVSPSLPTNQDVGVVKLLPDGSPDANFGIGGRTVVTYDEIPGGLDYGLDVGLRADGRILVAGAAQYAGDGSLHATLFRLEPDGDLDASFGMIGRRSYDFEHTLPSSQAFLGLALAGDFILASGIVIVDTGANSIDVFVARMTDDTIFANGFDAA